MHQVEAVRSCIARCDRPKLLEALKACPKRSRMVNCPQVEAAITATTPVRRVKEQGGGARRV
jgi:hypothetical protein